jgi:hypothetical protein
MSLQPLLNDDLLQGGYQPYFKHYFQGGLLIKQSLNNPILKAFHHREVLHLPSLLFLKFHRISNNHHRLRTYSYNSFNNSNKQLLRHKLHLLLLILTWPPYLP